MRIFIAAILLVFATASSAQQLVLKNGHFIVLYADAGESVILKENTITGPGESMWNYAEFMTDKEKIKSRMQTSNGKSADTYREGFYNLWPENVRINNNGGYVYSNPDDSLVRDSKGNITEVYAAAGSEGKPRTLSKKYFYRGGEEVYELVMEETNGYAQLYLYKLDEKGNILARLLAEADDDMTLDEMDAKKIRWKEEIAFDYFSKKENLLVKINWYKYSNGTKSLVQFQTFITAKHKVTMSKVYEKIAGYSTNMAYSPMMFDQRYLYSNW
jgi:hypothetical protein